jgi:hypothetical protein
VHNTGVKTSLSFSSKKNKYAALEENIKVVFASHKRKTVGLRKRKFLPPYIQSSISNTFSNYPKKNYGVRMNIFEEYYTLSSLC